MKINLVMIVKNEERSLERCLTAAAPLVSNMVIVDTGSTDHTKEIAEQFGRRHSGVGVRVYDFAWVNDFSAARNYALTKSETEGAADYNLVLDADEYLQNFRKEELEAFVSRMEKRYGKKWSGAIRRRDHFGDSGEMRMTALPRLLPAGVRYEGIIHEQPVIDGPCILTGLAAEHDGYLQEGKGQRNLAYLDRALKESPEDPYFNYQMGTTLRNLGETDACIPYFSRFYQRVCGKEKESENLTGMTSKKDGKMTESKTAGNKREERNKREDAQVSEYIADGILQYLYALKDTGTPEALERALQITQNEEMRFRESTDYYFFCGLFYVELVKSDIRKYMDCLPRIEASYRRCISIGERDGQTGVVGTGSFLALYNLGIWYELNNRKEEALACYREASEMGYLPAGERISEILN